MNESSFIWLLGLCFLIIIYFVIRKGGVRWVLSLTVFVVFSLATLMLISAYGEHVSLISPFVGAVGGFLLGWVIEKFGQKKIF